MRAHQPPPSEISSVRIVSYLSPARICSPASTTATTVRTACGPVIWIYMPREIACPRARRR